MKNQGSFAKAITMFALTVLVAAPLLAPLPAAAKDKKPAPFDTSKLVWPPAPAQTRLRYLAEYHGEDVKGIKKQGMLERLAGVQDLSSKSMLIKPYGAAFDSKGRAYVSDSVLHLVFVFDTEHKTLEYRGEKAPASFKLPMGLAIDSKDRLFVSDATNHNITVFAPEGDVVDIFGENELTRPVGLAIDVPLNRLYVADVKGKKVAQYNLETFKFERWVGKSAEEKLEEADIDKALVSPTSLAVDADGLLYVVDTFTNRIVVFDTDGEYVRHIGDTGTSAGRFMRPRGIALDSDGHLYVSDGFVNWVQVLNSDGKALMPVGGPGTDPGSFQAPAAMAFDKDNRLLIVDQNNRRIQIFRYLSDADAAKKTELPAPDKSDGKKKK